MTKLLQSYHVPRLVASACDPSTLDLDALAAEQAPGAGSGSMSATIPTRTTTPPVDPAPWADRPILIPTGRRTRLSKLRIDWAPYGPETFGQARRLGSDEVQIRLNHGVILGLARNDREAWLTLFHEIGHLVYGDCDRPAKPGSSGLVSAEGEKRAEDFAVFMVDAINTAMRMSVSRNSGDTLESAVGEIQVRKNEAVFGNRRPPRTMTDEQAEAYDQILGERRGVQTTVWRAFWQSVETPATGEQAFATYRPPSEIAEQVERELTGRGPAAEASTSQRL